MQYNVRSLTLAAVLAASAGAVLAQQQPYGRDSVHAHPTQVVRQAAVVTAQFATEPRFGRDSVFATPSPTGSSTVATNTAGLQTYGRGSVYAIDPAAPTDATRVARAPSGGSRN